MAAACPCPLNPRDCRVSHFVILAFRRVLAIRECPLCGLSALNAHFCQARKPASYAADFYPAGKAPLRQESAHSEEDREDLGCHLGQGLRCSVSFTVEQWFSNRGSGPTRNIGLM